MTNILELLKNEKVEWKKLGEVIDYEQPTKYIVTNTNYNDDYDIPVLTAGQTFILGYTNEKEGIYKATINEPVIIFDDFTTSNHWVDFSFKIKSSAMKILKPKQGIITFRYCYHYMKTINIDVTEHKRMWISKFSNIEIPIPSLETQEKIVEILDKFTNYVTELQSELQSRTKQYTYYRDKLLSEEYLTKMTKEMEEDRKVNTLRLEEVCEFKRGKRLVKSELQEDGEFPVYQNSIIPLGYYHEKNFERDNTFIISAGAAGEIVYSDREFWAADDVYVLKTKENITSKYLYYLLLSKQYIIKSKVRKASIPRLSKDDIEKILVDIPPLSLQNKVVKVLDKFQVLLADTKGLLPAEIEERQKQYEYYREKLLTFDAISDRFDSIRFITSLYYDILQEATNIVEVDIEDKVHLKTLSDISREKLSYGSGAKAVPYDENIRYIRITDIDDNGQLKQEKVSPGIVEDKYMLKKGDILFARSGATVGKNYIHLVNEKAIYAGYLIKFAADTNKVLCKYVYHCVNNSMYEKFISSMKSNASQPNINAQQYSNYKVIVPPLHVQQHVVSILDKFETLVNDIKEGLPKEIEQRQKQYEYWRECLLNFPR